MRPNLLCAGNEHRSIATTKMNEASSRSHSLLCVNILKTVRPSAENPKGERKRSQLTLVDLAGSVRTEPIRTSRKRACDSAKPPQPLPPPSLLLRRSACQSQRRRARQ